MILDNSASVAAQAMQPALPLTWKTLESLTELLVGAKVIAQALYCQTRLGTVEVEIRDGVAWIYQVNNGEETIWWYGSCRSDELYTHIKAAVANANKVSG